MAAPTPNILFVSGLVENVTEEVLYSAFIPFGEIKNVQVARDFVKDKAKGFGFIEFESEEDTGAAIENMDGAELFGKTIHCKIAKNNKLGSGKSIWSSEDWKREMDETQEGIEIEGGEDI